MAQVYPFGDHGIIVTFGREPSEDLSKIIRNFCFHLEEENIDGIIEWVPTYLSVTIYYNPYNITYKELKSFIEKILTYSFEEQSFQKRIVHIPVCYEEFGVDLETVAHYHQLTTDEVITLHTEPTYFVYMLGFAPGFPYLGGLNPKIATPRKTTPRLKVEAGSVGIAGKQTGIYTIDSPGGWQIIGRTPLSLYDPKNENPVLLNAFDYLKFEKISLAEFQSIKNEIEKGTYEIKMEWGNGNDELH